MRLSPKVWTTSKVTAQNMLRPKVLLRCQGSALFTTFAGFAKALLNPVLQFQKHNLQLAETRTCNIWSYVHKEQSASAPSNTSSYAEFGCLLSLHCFRKILLRLQAARDVAGAAICVVQRCVMQGCRGRASGADPCREGLLAKRAGG